MKKQPTGDPIFVFESNSVGYKVVAATGYSQNEPGDHFVVLRDGLTWDEACGLAQRVRKEIAGLPPCDCVGKAPTYPVFRSNPHLTTCPHYDPRLNLK